MIKWCMTIMAVGLALAPVSAPAQVSLVDYGWDDNPDPIILGKYNDITATLSTTQKLSPDYSLKLVDGGGDTPYVYVAWITGLAHGDQVTASAWIYDTTPGASPSGRLWAHYTSDPGDIDSFAGSTNEGTDYSSNGWTYLEHTWTFDVGDPVRDGMVIEVRTYTDDGDTVWVDGLSVSSDGGVELYYPGSFVPIPHVFTHVTTMTTNGVAATIELCGEAPDGYAIDDYIITETVATGTGTLSDNGGLITAPPDHTVNGTLTYAPPLDWSGLASFWYKVTDTQAPPQSSAETVHEIAVQKGGVVISEVMINPNSYDSSYEFIEIYNYSGATVNLGRVDAVPVVSNYDMPTTDNLLGLSIANGEWMIIAIDPTAEYPEARGKFRCEWGLLESDQVTYSLPDGTGTEDNRLLEVPLANWEYLWASPAGTCQDAAGARILLFDDGGELLDALDLSLDGYAGDCYGSSYAFKHAAVPSTPPDAVLNDTFIHWVCSSTYSGGRMTGGTADQASPGFIPGYSEAPDYEGPCYGACCVEDGSCVADQTVIECYDSNGYWKGPDAECDIGNVVACLNAGGGPVNPVPGGCDASDLNDDGHVDLYDYYLYQLNVCLPLCTTIADGPRVTYPDEAWICVLDAVISNSFDLSSSTAQMSFHIQDQVGTNGLMVWGYNADIDWLIDVDGAGPDTGIAEAGDAITIKGYLQNYWDTPEVFDVYYIEVTGNPGIPAPFPLLAVDLVPLQPINEQYLSTLVVVENVFFVDANGVNTFAKETNYIIEDATTAEQTQVRISGENNPLDGQVIPSGTKDVTGILTQYNNVYQVKPRSMADIVDP